MTDTCRLVGKKAKPAESVNGQDERRISCSAAAKGKSKRDGTKTAVPLFFPGM